MSLTMQENSAPQAPEGAFTTRLAHLRTWLCSWEIYPLVAVAAFLRLYLLNTSEFDADQANIFRLAYDAIAHGHLIATSNMASIGIYNPPATEYFLMVSALLSANPLAGAIWTAFLSILAVVLTYVFVRRYYGRLAATISASFYGTATVPLSYARFMWNQNFLLLFVPLFIAVLFWGVVERRRGWLGPAIFLQGLLIQLHATGALLAVPLVGALLLAPWKTFRWRDLLFGALGLLIIYAPYLLWLMYSHYRDVHILLAASANPVLIDDQSLLAYEHFLTSFPYANPGGPNSLLYPYLWAMTWLGPVLTGLTVVSMVLALVLVIRSSCQQDAAAKRSAVTLPGTLLQWWQALRASPFRCGLLILLLWQLPVLYLLRHSVYLHAPYFIIFQPGPFILLGFLLARLVTWAVCSARWGRVVPWLIYAFSILVVLIQLFASTGFILDRALGRIGDDGSPSAKDYFNTISSLTQAMNEAEQVAQQHHLNRIYVSSDVATQSALRYLAELTPTPTTVMSNACLVLPAPTAGPAVLLVAPYNNVIDDLATNVAHATLVASPPRLGGPPFRIYIVNPLSSQPAATQTLSQSLNFIDEQPVALQGTSDIVTRWSLLHSVQPSDSTTYTYDMINLAVAHETQPECTLTSQRAGDQLLVVYKKPAQATLAIQVQSYETVPVTFTVKHLLLTFDTFATQEVSWQILRTRDGKESISIPVSGEQSKR